MAAIALSRRTLLGALRAVSGTRCTPCAAMSTAPGSASFAQSHLREASAGGSSMAVKCADGASPNTVDGGHTEVSVLINDRPGALNDVLNSLLKHGVNLTHIASKPTKNVSDNVEITMDIEGNAADAKVATALKELKAHARSLEVREPVVVPWFPTTISDIDHFSIKTLDAGGELESDHPGFSDTVYRERRRMIVDNAAKFRHGDMLPRVTYSADETRTWGVVYNRLRAATKEHAVHAYNDILPLMEAYCGYSDHNIPQLEDISTFLRERTGFSLRPVGGLLSARDFLNGLAFRVFFSTQYIRHHSRPLYTPEPDVVHELMGHAPMFADQDFADFSHEIGLASLGASDADIKRLATCYWFSVEFGLCMEEGKRKAYGAGLLSSFGELEYACSPTRPAGGEDKFPEYKPWDPFVASMQEYPITTYQPLYYVADSLADAKTRMKAFYESINKGFSVQYNPTTRSVKVDRAIKRGAYTVTLQT